MDWTLLYLPYSFILFFSFFFILNLGRKTDVTVTQVTILSHMSWS